MKGKKVNWRDLIVFYSVSLLIVAVLSFYGGLKWGVDRKEVHLDDTQAFLAIGRACIDYVHGLRPRKVVATSEAAAWISNNCERIAQRSVERINFQSSLGEIRRTRR